MWGGYARPQPPSARWSDDIGHAPVRARDVVIGRIAAGLGNVAGDALLSAGGLH